MDVFRQNLCLRLLNNSTFPCWILALFILQIFFCVLKKDCKRMPLKLLQIVCIPVCKFSCIKPCINFKNFPAQCVLPGIFYADNVLDKIPSLKNARIVFNSKKYCLYFYMSNPMTKKVTNLFCLAPLLYDRCCITELQNIWV